MDVSDIGMYESRKKIYCEEMERVTLQLSIEMIPGW